MEINRYDDVIGVIPTADTVEGRFVVLDAHTFDHDFGSYGDVPGAHVPADTTEAKRAKYCVTFALDNRPTPLYQPMPSMSFALRGGFDQAKNVPFSATVYLTHPGNQEGLTIPSGEPAIAFTDAVVTLPSGAYVYSSNIAVPGALIAVQDATTDSTAGEAGKPKYASAMDATVVGEVQRYDSSTGRLTVRIY